MTAGRRSILRMIALLLAWVIAGATLNVAVAWGLWLWGERPGSYESFRTDSLTAQDQSNWSRWSVDDWPAAPEFARAATTFGLRFRSLYATVNSFSAADLSDEEWRRKAEIRRFYSIDSCRVGWPMALAIIEQADTSEGQPPVQSSRSDAFHLGKHYYPSRPLWPGFAINTVFYAGVLWVLCCGPFALRRMIRRRRGQCARCAYPIGQSPVCTECGAPHASVTKQPRLKDD